MSSDPLSNATPNSANLNPQELAETCAKLMWRHDHASKGLGMEIITVSPGAATLKMKVVESMCNGHGNMHGGMIFTLADSAFAFACNSYNQLTVAQAASIQFLKPAQKGDILIANAVERHKQGRNGLYDIRVSKENGEVIAEFRGQSRTIKGTHLPE